MPTAEEILAELPEGEPMTAEELLLRTPYSETDQWARMLLGQIALDVPIMDALERARQAAH